MCLFPSGSAPHGNGDRWRADSPPAAGRPASGRWPPCPRHTAGTAAPPSNPGDTGAGKTTLIKLLSGLLEPISGEIFYDNRLLKNISIKERSKIFSYVSQKSINSDDFNVKDYLTYGVVNSLKFYEHPKDEHVIEVLQVSKKLNIEHLLDKKIGQLSGGEKQIITIAAAIIQNTPVIILDEPTSALDLKNQNSVLSLLKEIAKDGKTIILSSHNPNHALYLDGNVVVLKKGEIVEFGNAKDVISIEKLQDVYGDDICYSDQLNYREISFKGKGQL